MRRIGKNTLCRANLDEVFKVEIRCTLRYSGSLLHVVYYNDNSNVVHSPEKKQDNC